VKLIEIAETLKTSKKRVGLIVHEYLYMRKLCAKWVCHACSQLIKSNNVLMTRSNVLRYSTIIKTNFSVDILQWMKHGCFSTFQSPIDSQSSGLNVMNRIQNVERRNGQLARLRHHYSVMRVVLYPSITSKSARLSTASITERLNDEIMKKCSFIKTGSQNDGKIS
jgi:hypothetical protein